MGLQRKTRDAWNGSSFGTKNRASACGVWPQSFGVDGIRLESVSVHSCGDVLCSSLRFHVSVCWISRENEVEEVKNEGPKEMTLDEWKAMQDKERTKVEFNIRKPNEGTDSQWKKGYVLHKSKSEDVSVATLLLSVAVVLEYVDAQVTLPVFFSVLPVVLPILVACFVPCWSNFTILSVNIASDVGT